MSGGPAARIYGAMTEQDTKKKSAFGWLLPKRFRSDYPLVPVVRLTGAIGMATPLNPGLSLSGVAGVLEKAFG